MLYLAAANQQEVNISFASSKSGRPFQQQQLNASGSANQAAAREKDLEFVSEKIE
jgi:hypothetical protein